MQLLAVHEEHEHYGVGRLALELNWSEKKTRRIRNQAGLTIARPSKKRRLGKSAPAEIQAPANALKAFAKPKNPDRPQDGLSYADMVESGGWAQDFTYIWFQGQWHYLAVVLNLKTRQVLGWRLGLRHSSELTYGAVLDALSKYPAPTILHSDQGTEYLSYKHELLCERMEITLSCSDKASPWQNGYMETWFGKFKFDLGPLIKYQDLAQLHEAIALQMHYYNTKRIHTALKMSPAAYAASLIPAPKRTDKVFAESRG
jgi:putative transposase